MPRLTLDFGIRLTWYNQMYPNDPGQQSVLALGRYSRSQIPTFYQPAFAPGNVRSALNPLTGAYLPAAYIGLFVPGDRDSGQRRSSVRGQHLPQGLCRPATRSVRATFGFCL